MYKYITIFAGISCRRQALCMVWYKPKNSKGLSTRSSKPGMSDFLPLNDSHTECSAVPI